MCFCTFQKNRLPVPPQNAGNIQISRFFASKIFILPCVLAHSGSDRYRPPPKLRTKTPPTRFRLLQNLQNLHFTMCLSTFRTCTPPKHRTKTPPRRKNDRFWCLRNRLYRGGPHASPKKGLSMMTFKWKTATVLTPLKTLFLGVSRVGSFGCMSEEPKTRFSRFRFLNFPLSVRTSI